MMKIFKNSKKSFIINLLKKLPFKNGVVILRNLKKIYLLRKNRKERLSQLLLTKLSLIKVLMQSKGISLKIFKAKKASTHSKNELNQCTTTILNSGKNVFNPSTKLNKRLIKELKSLFLSRVKRKALH